MKVPRNSLNIVVPAIGRLVNVYLFQPDPPVESEKRVLDDVEKSTCARDVRPGAPEQGLVNA